ncbi:ribose-5-phosphate isomerase RpiA [Methylobacillus flagellatus]|uniref:Ribose-5-phosphate isomerase A n=2 Tax=root TaxID=1 RepID=Q1H2B3_METFK|nr:ribose-5-phosphate isomerase RpiA [Methylobacillus flagellatus]ABE49230.1 ribose 5-phosphate isomerase [Methylobacillus flagellatus KT]ABE49374.1 ribose-5-phosphate isomerase [Methylobacillus flagellatus KT]ABZ07172.1 putative Ribose 5-phosphate isomerase A (phosphoriboisomerase A) [uncultured marine microorganism HF4000_ANIW133B20]
MNDKQLVAIQAAQHVQDGMVVGLGTGSTANYFIEELARRHRDEGLHITAAASSVASTIQAQTHGLPLVALEHLGRLDLYVDGADEVTTNLALLKGRGYDLVREKLLARASERFIVLVDKSKLVGHLGEKFPIPLEVIPFAWQLVQASLQQLGIASSLRQNAAKDGWAITSHGSLVLELTLPKTFKSDELNRLLNDIPGIVEHGVFDELADAVFVADNGQVEEIWKRPGNI